MTDLKLGMGLDDPETLERLRGEARPLVDGA